MHNILAPYRAQPDFDIGGVVDRVRDHSAVVALVVSENGELIDANRGFHALTQETRPSGINVGDFFVQPNFDQLSSAPIEPFRHVVYRGVINVRDCDEEVHSLLAMVWREGDRLSVVAEHDVQELLRLNNEVMTLNEQLADSQRELSRRDRRLTELLGQLQQERDSLEQRVSERTEALEVAKVSAEKANQAKSVFLANLSHELRTPLNGVMGMMTLALRRATDPKQISQLQKANAAGRHLLSVINDILDISRIEAKHLQLARESFSLLDVLTRAIENLEPIAHTKGLELRYVCPEPLARSKLLGDPTRLEQIIINLAGNALKFTKTGWVEVRVVPFGTDTAHPVLKIEVQDTGIGLSLTDQQRIFLPFEQADNSDTREFGGTGLGLSICQQLVQMMGGEIGVVSQPGAGSTFWFTLPFDATDGHDKETPDSPSDQLVAQLQEEFKGSSILLVDDDKNAQDVLREFLESAGLRVFLADDGAKAVEAAKVGIYSLILMDIKMPTMSGIDATYAIRTIAEHAHTPIVAITANAFSEDREACIRAGMNDHIAKPISPEAFYRSVLKWLRFAKNRH